MHHVLFWNLETYPQRQTRKIYWPGKSRMEARSADRRAAVIDIGPTARINLLSFSASRWHYSVATVASRASVCDEFLRAICDAWVSAWWSMSTMIYGHDSKMRTSRWCRNVDFWKWEIYWIRITCDKRMAWKLREEDGREKKFKNINISCFCSRFVQLRSSQKILSSCGCLIRLLYGGFF